MKNNLRELARICSAAAETITPAGDVYLTI